jgi:hypothetical protein
LKSPRSKLLTYPRSLIVRVRYVNGENKLCAEDQ